MKNKRDIWVCLFVLSGILLILQSSCNSYETVTDIDGNVYRTVKIGTQVWMSENLKTTRYSNSDTIPNVTDPGQWTFLTTGAYCNYDNNPNNVNTYGRLYNWYAVSDSRNIAPKGWHVATYDEWILLINYLGGNNVASGKLKETGTKHWASPNIDATNKSGFSALPGGNRYVDGSFTGIGVMGHWWLANESISGLTSKNFYLFNDSQNEYNSSNRQIFGYSIRCVKD